MYLIFIYILTSLGIGMIAKISPVKNPTTCSLHQIFDC